MEVGQAAGEGRGVEVMYEGVEYVADDGRCGIMTSGGEPFRDKSGMESSFPNLPYPHQVFLTFPWLVQEAVLSPLE